MQWLLLLGAHPVGNVELVLQQLKNGKTAGSSGDAKGWENECILCRYRYFCRTCGYSIEGEVSATGLVECYPCPYSQEGQSPLL